MFIDTHTHVTWGIDDGIQTYADCLEALKMYQEDEVEALIATPHFIPGKKLNIDLIRSRMKEMDLLCARLGIDYYPGCEFMLNEGYESLLMNGCFIPLAYSKYLLVEFDVRKPLGDFDEVEERLYRLFDFGLIPVIAHVERYFPSGLDLERVQGWIDMGCLLQVNRTSILGLSFKVFQENAFSLLDKKMVSLVASDMHRINGSRIPRLSDVYMFLKKRVGEENALILLYYNPMHIIEHKSMESMVPFRKKRHFFFK